ncbi:MAG: hypothetical protein M3Q26_01175 [Acidobacteriota bacterium]|nr:hypothetical protein [Acidobacteriota bacterium]
MDDDYAGLQMDLCKDPQLGEIIRGSGGIRKIRWAIGEKGKSGGARVIYYWAVSREKILMLDIYKKNEKVVLSRDELFKLRKKVEELLK